MKNSEYRRLMAYHNAKHLSFAHSSRPAPTRRSAKHPSVGVALKHSRIMSEPVEKLYYAYDSYKSVNTSSRSAQQAS